MDTVINAPTGDNLPPEESGPTVPLNETTRWLCSQVLLDRRTAATVFEKLCIPKIGAPAPSPGIDLVHLGRHAAWALHEEGRRAAGVAAFLVGTLVVALFAGWQALTGGGWLLLTLVVGVLLLLLAKLWSVVLVVALARDARKVITNPLVEERAGEMRTDQRERLRGVNVGNVLVYDETRSNEDGPSATVFPGFGHLAGHEVRVPVNISRPRDPSRGIGTVTAYDLLEHLAERMPDHIDETEITQNGRAVVAAHVLGSEVPGSELLDDSNGPCRSTASVDLVRRAANRPTRGVRAYVRAQVIGHGGHIVTTLHLSAVVGSSGLSLNFVLHALAPLHDAHSAAKKVPSSALAVWWWAWRREPLWVAFLLSPLELRDVRRLERRAQQSARREEPKRRAGLRRRTRAEPYGARGGLRWAGSHQSGFRFNEGVDIKRQANDLMHAAFVEVSSYLEERNIDTTGLDDEERTAVGTVIQNITTNVIGAVFDGDITIAGDLDASVRYLEGGED